MDYSELYVGMRVRIKRDEVYPGCDFYHHHDGEVGVIDILDDEDAELSVHLRIDSIGATDWGNHRSLTPVGSDGVRPEDRSIREKLEAIEGLVSEIKEML